MVKISNFMILLELLFLILKIFYDICESTYRFFIPKRKKSVAGEIVLITGAGRGIGKELAIGYASLGATVVCCGIHQKNIEQTMNEIKQMGMNSVYAYQCDVANRDEVFRMAEKVKREVGDVTILINNAVIVPLRQLLNYSADEISRTIDVNVVAHYWTIQAFLSSMIEKDHGHVVAVSSLGGVVGINLATLYCSTKFAIGAMMQSIRDELRKHSNGKSSVKFTTVLLPLVNTGLLKKPKMRFPKITGGISPQRAALSIIDAQRQNFRERFVPAYLHPIMMILANLPEKAMFRVYDFLGLGAEEDV